MTFKKAGIILLIILSILVAYEVYAQTSTEKSIDSNFESIENIRKIIGKNTPDFLAKPIIWTTLAVEDFRSSVGTGFESQKVEVKNKPAFFLFTILSFIFNNKLMFYGSALVIVFLILRFIWHRIF